MSFVSCEHKEFLFGDKRVILDIGRNKLYQLDEISCRILHALQSHNDNGKGLITEVERAYSSEEVQEALAELKELELVHESEAESCMLEFPQLPAVQTLCLHLIHNCNLRCSYCYGKGGNYGTPKESMSYSTAVEAVEFLLGQTPQGRNARISFFGGEPLLRWDLLRKIIPYIRLREEEEKKRINLSITTNGTLLTDEIIRFLNHYHIRVAISLDGPAHIHNKMRVFPNGSGSYHHILPNIKKLLQLQGRCSIRATLNPNEPQLIRVIEHLLQIGATFVHTELASDIIGRGNGKLSPQVLKELKREYCDLKKHYIQTIRKESRLLPIFAFIRILRMLTGSGLRRYYGCAMGRAYLTLSPCGEFYPCHRFVDQKEYLLGDLRSGLSEKARERFTALHVHHREICRSCWARYLCGGGCYYESVVAQGDVKYPDPIHCELTRQIITEAIEIGSYLSQISPHRIREMVERLEEMVSYL